MKAAPQLVVRDAGPEDEDVLFRWRNEPWIVKGGASQRPVTREEHHAWYSRTLTRQDRELFIVVIDGIPAGMIRYDLGAPSEAEISTYLFPDYWGKGFGRRVFMETAPAFCLRRGVSRLVARIRSDNAQSLAFFGRLGFEQAGAADDGRVLIFHKDGALVRHSQPSITEEEIAAVVSVLRSGHVAQGPRVAELEARWCLGTGTTAAAAVGSGLGALRLALLALGVAPGDEVIVPAYSCVALMNAALALGAAPVLTDVLPDEWTLSPVDVRRRITPRTRAIVAVHVFGMPAPVPELLSLNVPVVEDCAHGIGGQIGGRPFGGLGAISIASFYATKMLAGGEGGMVAAIDSGLIDRVRRAREYGDQPPDGRHLNDKMSDMEAALALVQLTRLPGMLAERERLARNYGEWLQPLVQGGLLQLPPEAQGRIWYRYAVRLRRHRAEALVGSMAALGVKAEQPVWDLRGTPVWKNDCPNTADAFDRVLSLPLYPGLSEFDQRRVCAALVRRLSDE
jgi:perosamine synthetase